jgi:hypothetical protein
MAGEIKRISEKYTKTITNVRESLETFAALIVKF